MIPKVGTVMAARYGDIPDKPDTFFNLAAFDPANVLVSKLKIRYSMNETQVQYGQVEAALVHVCDDRT